MPSTYIYEYPSVPLKFSRWVGSHGTEHSQAWVGSVNTASLNSTQARQHLKCVY